jgi:hypothetical protein
MAIRALQRSLLGALVLMLALPLVGTPHGLEAQQATAGSVEDRLLAFARVHLEISEIRDDLHQDLARYHEVDGRTRVRRQADDRIAEAMETHGVAAQEYEEFITAVSFDPELMAAFEEALDRARRGSSQD